MRFRVTFLGVLIASALVSRHGDARIDQYRHWGRRADFAAFSVQFGALQSDDHMFAFDEQQNVKLAAALPVDISQPGQYGPDCNCDPLTPGTIPAGSYVSSLFVHADPPGGDPPSCWTRPSTRRRTVGIEVCGPAKPSVCGDNRGLDRSDAVLGAPGTSYSNRRLRARHEFLDPARLSRLVESGQPNRQDPDIDGPARRPNPCHQRPALRRRSWSRR